MWVTLSYPLKLFKALDIRKVFLAVFIHMGVGVSGDDCCNSDDGWGDETDDKNYSSLGFPCDSTGKESACHVGDLGSIPELGKSPEEGKGYPLQYSGLENSTDCVVRGVTKNRMWLSDFH